MTALRWNHGTGRALLCVGNKAGALAFYDPVRNEAREVDCGKFERESPVVDLQWYGRGGIYFRRSLSKITHHVYSFPV